MVYPSECPGEAAVDARVAVFNGTTGKIIKDRGFTIGKSVPSDAKFTDTTYSAATQSAQGLMSAADKKKLDGIATGANAYTLTAEKVVAAFSGHTLVLNGNF